MKKHILSAIIGAFFLSACDDGAPKKAEGEKTTASAAQTAQAPAQNTTQPAASPMENANRQIELYNRLTELVQEQARVSEHALAYMDEAKRFTVDSLRTDLPPLTAVTKPNAPWAGKHRDTSEIPAAFGDAQAAMQADLDGMNDAFKRLETALEATASYLNAEDFKDDKGEKLNTLRADAEKALADYVKHRDALLAAASAKAQAAEDITMADHPRKDAVLAMRKTAKLAEDALNAISTQANAGQLDIAALQTHYDAFAAQAEATKALTLPADSNDNHRASFESFHQNADNILGEMRKILRAIKETQDVDANAFNSAASRYQSLLNDYNRFIRHF